MSFIKKNIWIIVLLLLSGFLFYLGNKIPSDQVRNLIEEFGPFAPIIFILLYLSGYIFAPFSNAVFMLPGFYLFGPNAIIFIYIAVTLGAAINFMIARTWGRHFVAKLVGRESMKRIDNFAEKYGLYSLIIFRIVHGGVGDFLSYAYGLTKIRFLTYMTITILASIPGQAIWYYLATKSENLESFAVFTGILITMATSLALIYMYFTSKKI